ncbi:MAG TPA: VOC family protein [Acidimicrobiia bacterium]|nr:VOC family protein [Acidimicrobiia bacterium]
MASVLREVVVDCRDPKALGRFWSDVLGWPLVENDRGYCWLSSTGEPWAPPPLLVFVPVPEPKAGKNRVHVDVNPSGCDVDEELERLLGLGATRVDVGQGDVPWYVLADPEGNEFCLLARRVDQ